MFAKYLFVVMGDELLPQTPYIVTRQRHIVTTNA